MDVFIVNKNNISIFVECLNRVYEKTLKIYKLEIIYYTKKVDLKESEKSEFIDVCLTYETLKNEDFRICYDKTCICILEKIRKAITIGHTEECISRAVVDIFFKYFIDLDYRVSHLCCTTDNFKALQFEILRDISWKIVLE
jgi:hypothetical protein